VPPLWVDGFTTWVTAALNADAEDDDEPLVPPPLLPPQAAATKAATAPTAASPMVLGLLMRWNASCRVSLCEIGRVMGYRMLLGSSASRSPSPNRLKAMTVMKMATPGMIMYIGSIE